MMEEDMNKMKLAIFGLLVMGSISVAMDADGQEQYIELTNRVKRLDRQNLADTINKRNMVQFLRACHDMQSNNRRIGLDDYRSLKKSADDADFDCFAILENPAYQMLSEAVFTDDLYLFTQRLSDLVIEGHEITDAVINQLEVLAVKNKSLSLLETLGQEKENRLRR